MNIRQTRMEDLPTLRLIFQNARRFMAEHGNPTQWGNAAPDESLVLEDIRLGHSWVCEEDGHLYATFALVPGEDPTYAVIRGAWKNDRPYATLHRIASTGERSGMMDEIVRFAFARYPNLRGDTHHDNLPMQKAFERNGFEECGVIWVKDGTPRIAYCKEK